MRDYLIHSDRISFAYPGCEEIISDFSLKLGKGEFIGIIGPSGAGKTSILKLMSGYLKPSSGVVCGGNGLCISRLPAKARAKLIAYVPQELPGKVEYTVSQMALMGRASRLNQFAMPGKKDYSSVDEALCILGLEKYKHTPFSNLSGGEKQRVLIAMAVAQEAKIIMLDEPTSALDIGHSTKTMKLLKKINAEKQVSIIVVAHDVQLISRYCSKLMLFSKRKTQVSGTPEEVLKPEYINNAYNCKVEILKDSNGNFILSPK